MERCNTAALKVDVGNASTSIENEGHQGLCHLGELSWLLLLIEQFVEAPIVWTVVRSWVPTQSKAPALMAP